MSRSRSAFTLIELMLAIALAMIVMTIAIPTIGSMFDKDDMHGTYEKFVEFVQKAQKKSVLEHRTILLVWHDRNAAKHLEAGLTLEPEVLSSEEADAEPETFGFGEAEVKLERPFALENKPLPEWPFWRSGTCEPVRVTYKDKSGHWVAEFDPLTTRPTLLEMERE